MRSTLVAVLCVAAGCSGGGSGSADAAGDGARICVAMPDIAWPAECDVIGCHEQVCDATCELGSTCQHLDCTDSPQCLLDCGSTPASQCQMIGCTAGTTDCGNGVVVCNRPCP